MIQVHPYNHNRTKIPKELPKIKCKTKRVCMYHIKDLAIE